jgi:hypothetical protein
MYCFDSDDITVCCIIIGKTRKIFVQNKVGATKVLMLLMALTTAALSKTQQHKCFIPGTG